MKKASRFMQMKRTVLKHICGVAVSLLAVQAFATTYYVKVDGDDSKDGKSWENAWATPKLTGLGGNGHEVVISNGVYHMTDRMYYGNSRTTLRGFSGKASDVILDGGGTTRLIGGNGTLSNVVMNLTLRNGYSNQNDGGGLIRLEANGGGMWNSIWHVYSNVVFSGGCHTGRGGAAYLAGGCTFYDCVFTNCTAATGGAVRSDGSNTTTFVRCTFADNRATNEGGSVFAQYLTDFRDCIFARNSSGKQGGALYLTSGGYDAVVSNCTFAANTVAATQGGAIHSAASANDEHGPVVLESTFVGNVGTNANGGAISGKFNLVRGCTFARNHAVRTGTTGGYGGVWYYSVGNHTYNPVTRLRPEERSAAAGHRLLRAAVSFARAPAHGAVAKGRR